MQIHAWCNIQYHIRNVDICFPLTPVIQVLNPFLCLIKLQEGTVYNQTYWWSRFRISIQVLIQPNEDLWILWNFPLYHKTEWYFRKGLHDIHRLISCFTDLAMLIRQWCKNLTAHFFCTPQWIITKWKSIRLWIKIIDTINTVPVFGIIFTSEYYRTITYTYRHVHTNLWNLSGWWLSHLVIC